MCKSTESNLTRVYTRMMLEDHFAHLYGPAAVIEDQKPLLLNKVCTDETDDVLEVLPPVKEFEEDEDQELDSQEKDTKEDSDKPRRFSARFESQDAEESRPLKGRRKRNSDTSTIPKRPPLLKRQTTLAMFQKTHEDDPSRLLQKALLGNPYNKLHHKYNPNLVDDEDQDINALLKKRRLRARRLALLAMHNNGAGTPERRESTTAEQEEVLANPLVPLAASFFLERAVKRKMLRKDPSTSKPEESEGTSKLVKLERQSAIGGTRTLNANGISTIGEESEAEVVTSRESSRDNSQKGERKKSEESEV